MINKNSNKFLFSIFFILLVGVVTGCSREGRLESTPEQPNGIVIETRKKGHIISPLIFGANYGPWVGVPYDMFEVAENSGITYLRFPGGEWGDQNDLKPYHFDAFMPIVDMLDATPQVNIRMQSGTPEQAADLVRFTNIESDYNIKYWAIGNEPNLYTNFPMYEDMNVDQYNKLFREYYKAMKSVDPNIIIIGPEITNYVAQSEPIDENGKSWMQEFLKVNGDIVDIVSFHRYPFPPDMSSEPLTKRELLDSTLEWDFILDETKIMIKEITGRDIPIAVTEINSDWTHATGGEATTDSFFNAIWWADVLGEMIEHDVEITAYFLLQCKISQGGYGLIGKYDIRPTYYVYQLYQNFGETFLTSENSYPELSVYAAHREDKAITVMLINKSENEIQEIIELKGNREVELLEIHLFDQIHNSEQVSISDYKIGNKIVIPAESIMLLVYNK